MVSAEKTANQKNDSRSAAVAWRQSQQLARQAAMLYRLRAGCWCGSWVCQLQYTSEHPNIAIISLEQRDQHT
jgi:hypothetical protein